MEDLKRNTFGSGSGGVVWGWQGPFSALTWAAVAVHGAEPRSRSSPLTWLAQSACVCACVCAWVGGCVSLYDSALSLTHRRQKIANNAVKCWTRASEGKASGVNTMISTHSSFVPTSFWRFRVKISAHFSLFLGLNLPANLTYFLHCRDTEKELLLNYSHFCEGRKKTEINYWHFFVNYETQPPPFCVLRTTRLLPPPSISNNLQTFFFNRTSICRRISNKKKTRDHPPSSTTYRILQIRNTIICFHRCGRIASNLEINLQPRTPGVFSGSGDLCQGRLQRLAHKLIATPIMKWFLIGLIAANRCEGERCKHFAAAKYLSGSPLVGSVF